MKYLIPILLLLTACRTTRNVQKFARQVDSTGFFKKDTSRVIKIDSTVTGAEKTVVITADSADYEQWTWIEEDSAIRRTVTHIRDKGVRTSKTITATKDSTALHKVDSASGKVTQHTAVKETLSGKGVDVKKTQGGLWWNLAFILAVLLAIYWVYLRYIKPRFL